MEIGRTWKHLTEDKNKSKLMREREGGTKRGRKGSIRSTVDD